MGTLDGELKEMVPLQNLKEDRKVGWQPCLICEKGLSCIFSTIFFF